MIVMKKAELAAALKSIEKAKDKDGKPLGVFCCFVDERTGDIQVRVGDKPNGHGLYAKVGYVKRARPAPAAATVPQATAPEMPF
jgi:hypothetical protein